MSDHKQGDGKHSSHHILSFKTGFNVLIALLIGTVITVAAARVDLGMLNFPIAMFIATVKALLVVLFFMGLKYDSNDNRLIFGISFVFFAIFGILTSTDVFFRGDVKVSGPFFTEAKGSGPKIAKPWVPTPELLARGKEMFGQNCVSCHGAEGKGDGAAAAALNPKPRNFTVATGWSNGRKPSQIFGTLTKGLRAMPSFASLPSADRWSLAHYVGSLGPTRETDSDADLSAAGVDPNKDDSGGAPTPSIPVEMAIDALSEG